MDRVHLTDLCVKSKSLRRMMIDIHLLISIARILFLFFFFLHIITKDVSQHETHKTCAHARISAQTYEANRCMVKTMYMEDGYVVWNLIYHRKLSTPVFPFLNLFQMNKINLHFLYFSISSVSFLPFLTFLFLFFFFFYTYKYIHRTQKCTYFCLLSFIFIQFICTSISFYFLVLNNLSPHRIIWYRACCIFFSFCTHFLLFSGLFLFW